MEYTIDDEKLYRVSEVVEVLNVGQSTVSEWIRRGKLKKTKILTGTRVKGSDLREFIIEKLK